MSKNDNTVKQIKMKQMSQLQRKQKFSKIFPCRAKQQKLLQRFLALPKMFYYTKNFKTMRQKIQAQDSTKSTS